jgi:hypothetical protein
VRDSLTTAMPVIAAHLSPRANWLLHLLYLFVGPSSTPHPVQLDGQLAGHRDFGGLVPAPHGQVKELAAPLLIAAHRHLRPFHQQETQQRIALLADGWHLLLAQEALQRQLRSVTVCTAKTDRKMGCWKDPYPCAPVFQPSHVRGDAAVQFEFRDEH